MAFFIYDLFNIIWSFRKNTLSLHSQIADMAQLVEQRIRNAWVPGSSPGIGSTIRKRRRVSKQRFLIIEGQRAYLRN